MAADGTAVGLGHNNPPEPSAFEAFTAHLSDLRIEAGNWLDGTPVENQAQADDVSRLLDEHRKAAKDADGARTAEKKPHLDAGKAVDAKWKPLVDGANLVVDACKKTLAPWLQKLEMEKRAVAEAARLEAQRQADLAAEAMRQAAPTDIAAREDAEAQVVQASRAAAEARRAEADRPQAHGSGRATTLRTYYEPVLVDQRAAVLHYMREQPDRFVDLCLELAKADVRAGKRQIPGFTVEEDRRVV